MGKGKPNAPLSAILIGIVAIILAFVIPFIIYSVNTCTGWGCGLGEVLLGLLMFTFGVVSIIVGIVNLFKEKKRPTDKKNTPTVSQSQAKVTSPIASVVWWFSVIVIGMIFATSTYIFLATIDKGLVIWPAVTSIGSLIAIIILIRYRYKKQRP